MIMCQMWNRQFDRHFHIFQEIKRYRLMAFAQLTVAFFNIINYTGRYVDDSWKYLKTNQH